MFTSFFWSLWGGEKCPPTLYIYGTLNVYEQYIFGKVFPKCPPSKKHEEKHLLSAALLYVLKMFILFTPEQSEIILVDNLFVISSLIMQIDPQAFDDRLRTCLSDQLSLDHDVVCCLST